MLTIKQGWTSTGSSGAFAAVNLQGSDQFTQAAVYVDHSTLATTQSINIESAQESTGPWLTEASTVMSTATSTNFVMRIAGPIGPFVRPRLLTSATGFYDVLLMGVAP